MSDVKEPRVVHVDDWRKAWSEGRNKWHLDHVHPHLEKHVDVAVNGKANAKVLFPFCGKTYDMKWSIECNFDTVWDRGGFTIINIDDRKKYIPLIASLMAPHARYMLVIDSYDRNVIHGETFDIKYVDKKDSLKPLQKSWGLTFFDETLYQLTLKL
ncbi:hypothetical protein NP493_538g04045 [Ridgeia piscesae]|uniref:Thiopurine S-methyltransferase n=1 Tax=Ridgeia piscesae TaxID=27915 RepID=A0AAD9KVU2_RIDPI|nr:hypothetical protein NP493_538g04045 [Ridgeia piscesae]